MNNYENEKKYTKDCLGYQIARVPGSAFFKMAFNPFVKGLENIPENDEPFIFCGNHKHKFDQYPVVSTNKRTIHWMAKEEYFEGKFAALYKATGCIRVDRYDQSKSKNCMIEAEKYLNAGSSIGLFPEGTRNIYYSALKKSEKIKKDIEDLEYKLNNNMIDYKEAEVLVKTKYAEYEESLLKIEEAIESLKKRHIDVIENEELLPFKFGAVAMAQKTNCRIIPFAVSGDYKFRSDNLMLSYGKPMTMPNGDLTDTNNELRNTITDMLNEQKVMKKR